MKMKKNFNSSYCNYSFDDLYASAFGKSLSSKEKQKLQDLPQKKINSLVLEWTKKAKWKTTEKKGTDGKIYLAFSPQD